MDRQERWRRPTREEEATPTMGVYVNYRDLFANIWIAIQSIGLNETRRGLCENIWIAIIMIHSRGHFVNMIVYSQVAFCLRSPLPSRQAAMAALRLGASTSPRRQKSTNRIASFPRPASNRGCGCRWRLLAGGHGSSYPYFAPPETAHGFGVCRLQHGFQIRFECLPIKL